MRMSPEEVQAWLESGDNGTRTNSDLLWLESQEIGRKTVKCCCPGRNWEDCARTLAVIAMQRYRIFVSRKGLVETGGDPMKASVKLIQFNASCYARRACLNRPRGRRTVIVCGGEEWYQEFAAPARPPDSDPADLARLRKLLRKLSAEQRAVVLLRNEGKEFAEISSELGLPLQTVVELYDSGFKSLQLAFAPVLYTE